MSESGPERPTAARFPTTRWSRVAAASGPDNPSARAALEGLCRDYWFPLYAFTRRAWPSPHEAEDIVQGFLADLLERGSLAGLDRSKGRFRSFLRAACDHYLANRRDHDRAAKRGGGITIVSIDRVDAESRYDREPSHELTAERLFEKQWALMLLGAFCDGSNPSQPGGEGRVVRSAPPPCRALTWLRLIPPSVPNWG